MQLLLKLTKTFVFLFSLLIILSSCESRRTIVNGLDEKEANEIIVFLSTRGIDVTKSKSTEGGGGGGGSKTSLWDITVDEEQATEAMSLLNQNGLPRRRGQNLLSIFANVGLVPSALQDKIRYEAGLAEQIASTIRQIDGVLNAEVQLSFPQEDPLNPNAEKKQKITASVYVKHSGVLDDPNSHLITKIKRLVSSAVTGLDIDNVNVISDRARFNEQPTGGFTSGLEDEKQYVSVWSIIVAKESLFRFRMIFFSFTLLILLLTLCLIWIGWKLYPVLKSHGGIKELFHIYPISQESLPEAEEKNVEENGSEESKKPETQEETAGKGIDET